MSAKEEAGTVFSSQWEFEWEMEFVKESKSQWEFVWARRLVK